jgi:hypothetical protein
LPPADTGRPPRAPSNSRWTGIWTAWLRMDCRAAALSRTLAATRIGVASYSYDFGSDRILTRVSGGDAAAPVGAVHARAALVVRSGCPLGRCVEGSRDRARPRASTRDPHRGDRPRHDPQNPQIGLRQNKTGSPRRASTNEREGTAVSACLENPLRQCWRRRPASPPLKPASHAIHK